MTADRYAAEREHSEPGDVATRERLGLRPIVYVNDSAHEHPDPNPCPSWCWIAADNPDGYTHEIEYDAPMRATHSMASEPSFVASLYGGEPCRNGDQQVRSTTFELLTTQRGSRDPMIQLYVRRWNRATREQVFDERLRMTVPDAMEMIAALQDVVARLGA